MKDKENKTKQHFNYQLFYRRTALIIYDILSVTASSFLAILLRYDMHLDEIPDQFLMPIRNFLPLNILLTMGIFYLFRLYHSLWAFAGENEMQDVYKRQVYSTVKFSEKMFRDGECVLGNYDLLGGWLCKSPLAEKKLKAFGYASLGQALLEGENVYLVAETGQSLDWLTDYFGRRGTVLRAEPKAVSYTHLISALGKA